MRVACSLLLLIAGVGMVVGCGGQDAPRRIRLATTTSTENSGLLRTLLPRFEAEYGAKVDVIAVGTGHALKLGRQGEADILLVHARKREDAFVAEGHGIDRRDVMWNDFVILGPSEDPAGIAAAPDAATALQQIAKAGALFVSRGDDSGTHSRERSLWEAGGGQPTWDGYLSAGQGMGPCLTMADEKHAYVLADRGTYLAYRGRLDLAVLTEGDASLRNPYGAMLVNPARHPHVHAKGARALLDFLTSPAGQEAIGAFRVDGQVLFHPVVVK